MRRILPAIHMTIVLAACAMAADAPIQKPVFGGNWQWAVDKSDLKQVKPQSLTLAIEQRAPGEIRVEELSKLTDGQEKKREFKCNTMGKECDYTEGGQPSKMSLYYNGPKLVAIERIGKDADVITKREYLLSEDGKTLTIEVKQLVPPREDLDKYVFTKQP